MKKQFLLRDLNVKRNALAFIANLPTDEHSPLSIKIAPMGRTLDQNALLWPLLECFSQQLQWPVNGAMVNLEPEEWKDILTAAYRNETQRVAMGLNGGMVMLGMRTSKMTKAEFSEFIEFIHAVAAEHDVNLLREAA
jgi:hypothetical protein